MKWNTQQINQIRRLKKDGVPNTEIAKMFGVAESTIRYQLGKVKKVEKERTVVDATSFLKKKTLESGLSKVLGKLDTALDHCGNENEDVKLTIEIGRFYASTLRLLDIAGEDTGAVPSEQEAERLAFAMGELPPEKHTKILDGMEKIDEKWRKKLMDDAGVEK